MDAEYAFYLNKEGQPTQNTFKSKITGLDYKVLPRSEKDLYAANLWKDTHNTAPTKKQVEATKKALDGKKTSSPGAKSVAEVHNSLNQPEMSDPTFSRRDQLASQVGGGLGRDLFWRNKFYDADSDEIRKLGYNPYSEHDFNTEKPSWLTPEMEKANKSINEERETINTLKKFNSAAANYYKKTGDLQGALDNYVAPDRFDVSSGSAGYSIGKAVNSGDMQDVDYLNAGMLVAGALGSKKGKTNSKLKQLNERNPRMSDVAETTAERTARGISEWRDKTKAIPGLKEYYEKKAKNFTSPSTRVRDVEGSYTRSLNPAKQQSKLAAAKEQKLLPGATKTSIDLEDEGFALAFDRKQQMNKLNSKLNIAEGADKYTKPALKRLEKKLDDLEIPNFSMQKTRLKNQMKKAVENGDKATYNKTYKKFTDLLNKGKEEYLNSND
jgi:hypothetical protein